MMLSENKITALANFDEIVFLSRNKDYGAYFLRKSYKKSLIIAFCSSCIIVSGFVVTPLIRNYYYNKNHTKQIPEKSISVVLENIDDDPIPPPPPLTIALRTEVKFVPPLVVDTVKEELTFETNDEYLTVSAPEISNIDFIVPDEKIFVKKDDIIEKEEPSFLVVEEPATFQGGDANNFIVWVLENIKYPQIAMETGITGKVFVQFAVNSKGTVVEAKVLRGVDPALDQEALRVVLSSPKWTPPKQGGRPVKQIFALPVTFKLEE